MMNVEGLIIPPRSYFEMLRNICDKYNVLLIYDEVITGFGRTGTMFFAEQAGRGEDEGARGQDAAEEPAPAQGEIFDDHARSFAAVWMAARMR
jgi:hypothetical protein